MNYDGRSLIPDLSGSLNIMLGYAQDQQQERKLAARQQEVAGLGEQLGAQGLNAALQSPDAVKTLTRMAQLDPQMAQFTVGLLGARDTNVIQEAATEVAKSGAFYQGVLTLKPEERRDALLAKARELKELEQPFEQVLEMAGQDPTQQEIGIRRKLVLSGQFQALAGPSLKEQLELQQNQLEFFKTQQEMLIGQEDADRRAAADRRAEEKLQTENREKAEQKQSASRSMLAKTQFIGEQLGRATQQLPAALSGRPGQIASFFSTTGDTASLRRTLDTITANIGFGELMRMKQESPTGGALGSVSERELELLNATLGNLDSLQSDADLYRVLQQVHSVYDRINRASGGEGLPALPPLNAKSQQRSGSGRGGRSNQAATAPRGAESAPAGNANVVDWGAL